MRSPTAGVALDRALARYDQERRAFGSKIVAHARHLGAYVETGAQLRKRNPDADLDPRPDIILRDYGAPHLLRDPIL